MYEVTSLNSYFHSEMQGEFLSYEGNNVFYMVIPPIHVDKRSMRPTLLESSQLLVFGTKAIISIWEK